MKNRSKRLLSAVLASVMLSICLSGCNVDPNDKSVLVLQADPNNQMGTTAATTTDKQSENENATGKADAGTASTASVVTATNGTGVTGASTKGNNGVGKATGGATAASKATRKTMVATKKADTLTAAQAKSIAEDLVYRYHQYSECAFGVVCDLEYVEWNTVKKFATSGKNGCHYSDAYRITCCHSIDEVKQHISRCLDASLIEKFQEGWFFTDDKNNVYLGIDYGHGCMGYGTVAVLRHSADTITAKAELVDIDGSTGIYDYFTIEKKNGNYGIASFQRDFNELKYGVYKGYVGGFDESEATLVLKENGSFTLNSNFDLKSLKSGSVFTLSGTYTVSGLHNRKISFYYENGEEYWTYWLGDDGTFFQDQCTVFNYVG